MSSEVLGTRIANALIEDAELPPHRLPGLEVLVPGIDEVHRILATFRQRYGGLWVGGRATLTTADLRFRPNAVNRAVQTGSLDVTVPLASVTNVELLRGVLTQIIAVGTPGFLVKIRCFRARAFADQIRSVAHQTRGG